MQERQQLQVKEIIADALRQTRRIQSEKLKKENNYLFIPFFQQRDSIGRLILPPNSVIGSQGETSKEFVRNRTPTLNFSSFKVKTYESRPREPQKLRERPKKSQIGSLIGKAQAYQQSPPKIPKRPATASRRPFTSQRQSITSVQANRKDNKDFRGPQCQNKNIFSTYETTNHIKKSGFVRQQGQRPKIILPQNKQESLHKRKPSSDQKPSQLRLDSILQEDTPQNMNQKWRDLVSKVEAVRKSIEESNLWAPYRSKY